MSRTESPQPMGCMLAIYPPPLPAVQRPCMRCPGKTSVWVSLSMLAEVELLRRYSNRPELLGPLVSVLRRIKDPAEDGHETVKMIEGRTASPDYVPYVLTEDNIRDLIDSYCSGTTAKALAERYGLGTFGDGLDRQRPMLVFANPLGWHWMDHNATLIHERDDLADEQALVRVREVIRSASDGTKHSFWAYRRIDGHSSVEAPAVDPFPTPQNRSTKTSARGRFVVDL